MDMAIRIGGAIMEDIFLSPPGDLADFMINPIFFPFLENLGFALGEVGLHGKGGFWQVQRIFVIHLLLVYEN
jgi:hypothetical protein